MATQNQTTALATRPRNYGMVKDLIGTSIQSNDDLKNFLQKAQDLAICIFPKAFGKAEPGNSLAVTHVSIDTNLTSDNKYNNSDCYEKNGRVILHWSKVNEIAKAAGVEFTNQDILIADHDAETGELVRVVIKQYWRHVYIDGRTVEGSSLGSYDYLAEKKEGKFEYEKRRGWGYKLAETNARVRSAQEALGYMPRSFSKKELEEKPIFVAASKKDVTAMLNSVSPENRKQFQDAVIAQKLGIVQQIYGNPAVQNNFSNSNQLPQTDAVNLPTLQEAEIVAESSTPQADELNQRPDGSLPEWMADERAEDFAGMDPTIRALSILDLIKQKSYVPQRPVTQSNLEKADFDSILRPLIIKLLTMPDDNKNETLPF